MIHPYSLARSLIVSLHFHTHSLTHSQMLGSHTDVDPEVLFTKQERIGKGSFGEVYKG